MSSDPPGQQGDLPMSFSPECIIRWNSILWPFHFLWRAQKSLCCSFLLFLYFLSSLLVSMAGFYSLFCDKTRGKNSLPLTKTRWSTRRWPNLCLKRENRFKKKKKKGPFSSATEAPNAFFACRAPYSTYGGSADMHLLEDIGKTFLSV